MKIYLLTLSSVLSIVFADSQTPVTAIDTSLVTAANTTTYTSGGDTYIYGASPYDTVVSLKGFTAGGIPYTYVAGLQGTVKLRRVDNANVTGDFSLVWAQARGTGTTFNMYTAYQNNMDSLLNNHIINQGADNLFDNTAHNSNNIERFDWILAGGYATYFPNAVGFTVFDKKDSVLPHDPFCIAAITSLDAMGNPASYGNIVRVVAGDYGDTGPSITYRILKGPYLSPLLDAGTSTQYIGGVLSRCRI